MRIALNVAGNDPEMLVALYRKRLIPALLSMAQSRMSPVLLPSPNMGDQKTDGGRQKWTTEGLTLVSPFSCAARRSARSRQAVHIHRIVRSMNISNRPWIADLVQQ